MCRHTRGYGRGGKKSASGKSSSRLQLKASRRQEATGGQLMHGHRQGSRGSRRGYRTHIETDVFQAEVGQTARPQHACNFPEDRRLLHVVHGHPTEDVGKSTGSKGKLSACPFEPQVFPAMKLLKAAANASATRSQSRQMRSPGL